MTERIDTPADEATDADLLRLFQALTPDQRKQIVREWSGRIAARRTGAGLRN